MQIHSLVAVIAIGLTPLVSAADWICPAGKIFYCCNSSSPLGGTCTPYPMNPGCPNGGPQFHACCVAPGVACTWAQPRNSCLCPASYTCPCS